MSRFCVAIALLGMIGVASCVSSYLETVAQQRLASGDYQGAEEALGSRDDPKAQQIRSQIRQRRELVGPNFEIQQRQGQAEAEAELKSATREFESGQYVAAHDNYRRASESKYLDEAQSLKAMDGICNAERKAGEPSYSPEIHIRIASTRRNGRAASAALCSRA